ncbi:tetratricopeptide repeat protein [Patescibacteria group bacterium]|nr:tetratricopeptide repeat protein [Patescibacteria group bacterium]
MSNLKEIEKLREQKGKEQEALDLISKAMNETKTENDMESLAKLNWEASLVHQHLVMNEKSTDLPNEEIIQKETAEMEKAALEAHKIIQENNLERLEATSHRFLGRVCTYKGDHIKAQEEYEKSIELIEKMENKEQLLELNGFLATTLLVNGKINEGVNLALKTFEEFQTSDIGKQLKGKDYYVWAVWRSGIISRMVFAMKEAGVDIEKEKWEVLLDTCESFLNDPEKEIWGNFQFRLDEIKKAREILNS